MGGWDFLFLFFFSSREKHLFVDPEELKDFIYAGSVGLIVGLVWFDPSL